MLVDVEGMVDTQFLRQKQPLLISASTTEYYRPTLSKSYHRRKKSYGTRPRNCYQVPCRYPGLLRHGVDTAGQQFGEGSRFETDAVWKPMNKSGVAIGGEATVVPIAQDTSLLAKIVVVTETIIALPAVEDGRLCRYPISDRDSVSCLATFLDHNATELVSQDDRRPDAVVDGVVVKMQVRATDARGLDFDLDLVGCERALLELPEINEPSTPSVLDDTLHRANPK